MIGLKLNGQVQLCMLPIQNVKPVINTVPAVSDTIVTVISPGLPPTVLMAVVVATVIQLPVVMALFNVPRELGTSVSGVIGNIIQVVLMVVMELCVLRLQLQILPAVLNIVVIVLLLLVVLLILDVFGILVQTLVELDPLKLHVITRVVL